MYTYRELVLTKLSRDASLAACDMSMTSSAKEGQEGSPSPFFWKQPHLSILQELTTQIGRRQNVDHSVPRCPL